MAIVHVKSGLVTNLDASPAVAPTAGEGGAARLKVIEGTATLTASATIDSTFQFVRVPSTAKIKKVFLESAAQTSCSVDVGVYYATDGQGGKPAALLASQAIDQDFFASAVNLSNAVAITDITNESGTYTADKRVQPLWQAVGLTADPGGSLDIAATVQANATTGGGLMGMTVYYAE